MDSLTRVSSHSSVGSTIYGYTKQSNDDFDDDDDDSGNNDDYDDKYVELIKVCIDQ